MSKLLLVALAALVFAAPATAARNTGDIQVTSGPYALIFDLSWDIQKPGSEDTISVDLVCTGAYAGRVALIAWATDEPFTFATSQVPGPSDCIAYLHYNRVQNNKVFTTTLDSESFHVEG